MDWVVVGVESGVGWPTTETRVTFRDRELILRPETDTRAPSVVAAYQPPDHVLRRSGVPPLFHVEGHFQRVFSDLLGLVTCGRQHHRKTFSLTLSFTDNKGIISGPRRTLGDPP